jgi:glycosyltransferase involved in cell wall biosynthesis
VDDGSTDDTAAVAEREAGMGRFRVLRHGSNLGKTEAMLTAAAATERTYLVLFDADLQHLPDEIPRFLAKLEEGWDIVTGRKIGTTTSERSRRRTTGCPGRSSGCRSPT